MTQGKRFLFVTWEGGGTVPPTLGLARRVIERGHRVSVLGDPTIEQQARAVGCHFTSWRKAPHRTTLEPEQDLLKDWETSNPLQMLARVRDRFIAGPAARYAADTLDALAEQRPDAMICDYALFGAHAAAEKVKVPTGALVPNIWPIPVPGIPPFGPGFALAKTSLGRLRDALVTRLVTRLFDRGLPALNAARRDLGLVPLTRTANRLTLLAMCACADQCPARSSRVGGQRSFAMLLLVPQCHHGITGIARRAGIQHRTRRRRPMVRP